MTERPSEERSRIMGAVRRQHTAPEVSLRRVLHACGLRFRLDNPERLPGSPDLRFARERVAVFVDGCFWHGCPTHGSWPKTNADFWGAKIKRNRERDRQVDEALKLKGWLPLRVWEHEIRDDSIKAAQRVWAAVRARCP
jgi:DNA mismatch endonuclease, patch repair protein